MPDLLYFHRLKYPEIKKILLYMRLLVLLYCCFFLPPLLPAQSLQADLRTWSDPGTPLVQRLRAATQLCDHYIKTQPDSARLIAIPALELAQKNGLRLEQGKLLLSLGMAYRRNSQFENALQCYEQSLPLFEQLADWKGRAMAYKNLGEIYQLQSNFPKAIDCISRFLSIAESAGDSLMMADAYVGFSTIYYLDTENQAKMEAYLLDALAIYRRKKHESGLTFVYNNLCITYMERGDYKKALAYNDSCIGIQERRNDLFGLATALHNRAMIHQKLGYSEQALADYEREIAIFEQFGDQEGLSDAYTGIAQVWLDQKKYPAAIRYCEQALQIAVEMGGYNIREADACDCLYRAYKARGDERRALQYLERLVQVKDTLQAAETEEKLRAMELERDSLSREKIQFQKDVAYQKTLRQKNNTLALLLLLFLLGSLVGGGLWLRMLYFQRQSLLMQSRTERLENQQLLNEIALLKTQVNPHFLFNSLSILSSLVHKDPNLSEQFVEQLARSYRYILEQKDQPLVPLRTELEFIQSYTFLLKIRFEDKFDVHLEVAAADLDRYSIAPLTLQLLIENAVKHNRMSAKEPLVVRIFASADKLVVQNALRPRGEPIASTGTGLQNILNRYALLSDQPVWAGEREGGFVVEIPLMQTN
jgi:tetratricopeptide (TPR) repeat protein